MCAFVLLGCDGDDPAPAVDATAETVAATRVATRPLPVALLADLTGPGAADGIQAVRGHEAAYAAANQAGGVCGVDVEAVRLDHGSDPSLARILLEQERDRILLVAHVTGAGPLGAVLTASARTPDGEAAEPGREIVVVSGQRTAGIVTKAWAVVTGPTSGVAFANLGFVRGAGYSNGTVVATVVVDDPGGDEALRGARAAISARSFAIARDDRFVAGATDFGATARALELAQPAIVFAAGPPASVAALVEAVEATELEPVWLLGDGSADAGVASRLAPYAGRIAVARVSALWGDAAEGMATFQAVVEAAGGVDATVGLPYMFGYVEATVTLDLLRAACAAGDVSAAGVREARAALAAYDTGDLLPPLDLSPTVTPALASGVATLDPAAQFGIVSDTAAGYFSTGAAPAAAGIEELAPPETAPAVATTEAQDG